MIVAVASRKSSPGVTTLTTLLAAYWAEENVTRLILEADPSGGTIAARWKQAHDLTWDPGLVAMSANRGQLDASAVDVVSQALGDGLRVAGAPPSPGQVTAALQSMGEQAAASLAGAAGVRTFVDCGRLHVSSPTMALARRAALTILVCRPTLEEAHTLMPGVAELRDSGCVLGLVTVGDGPYHPTEIAENAGVELLGHVPHDDGAAARWAVEGLNAGRVFRRSLLARTVNDLTALVADRCAHTIAPDALLGPVEQAGGNVAVSPATLPHPEPIGFAALLEGATSAAPAPSANASASNGAHGD